MINRLLTKLSKAVSDPFYPQGILGFILVLNPDSWLEHGVYDPNAGAWIGVGLLIASVISFVGSFHAQSQIKNCE
jgi:hypothetical protein